MRVLCRQGHWEVREEVRLGDSGAVSVACGRGLWLAATGNTVVELKMQGEEEELKPATIITTSEQIQQILLNTRASLLNNP